jgi:hypothetical protein
MPPKSKTFKSKEPKTNSIESYLKTYVALIKEAGTEDLSELLTFIKNCDKKDRTKHNKLNAIISLDKHMPNEVSGDIAPLKKARDELQKAINKSVSENNLSERQSAVLDKVSMDDIYGVQKKLKECKGTSEKILENYILISLMIPPLRNDLQDVKVVRGEKLPRAKTNVILVPHSGAATLAIRDHKTTSRGGKPIMRELDAGLSDDIRAMVSDKRTHLFVDKYGKPYSDSAFSHRMSQMFDKLLGHKITSTILRKIYLTGKYGATKSVQREMKEDAEQMGHSVATQQTHYVAD